MLAVQTAAAQEAADATLRDARQERLGAFSTQERALLSPHLDHGPAVLVEFSDDNGLPAVIMATRVHAPASLVARVIADPRAYPRFMPALDEVEVQSRRGTLLAYRWTWRTALFTLTGNNVMTTYPAPTGRADRPHRIAVESTGGDLGEGRLVWRVYPETGNRSLLVLSSRLDLRDANYVARELQRAGRSVNRTINISLSMIMLLGTKRETERVAGAGVEEPQHDLPALRRADLDVTRLAPMLARGDLLLLDMDGPRLNQAAIIGRMGRGRAQVREVMTNPRDFGSALVPGSYARVVAEEDNTVTFDWGIDLPLIGTSGRMRLTDSGSSVAIDAIGGALNGGEWRFETVDLPWGEATVIGLSRFDPTDASWLIRLLVQGNRDFGYGITAGTQVMVMRALRTRVHEL